ncbi:hypothetical protein J3R82DRAFT_6637 [Butyriboletus roseoflavus]|nr:hypothetical protein J3R82DRAFT_6637 [Butyriboletus roseoflavus]
MATLMQNSSQPATSPLPPDLEPDDEWKQSLKVNIEAGLRSMVDEAKQKLNDELAKGIIGAEERERLTADHLATLKTIRQLAEEQFRIALERERQERRWASGEQLDQAWSESMMKEQQAILDRIERERQNKAPETSFQPDPPQLHPLLPPPPPPPPPPPLQFHSRPDAPPPENFAPTPLPSNRKAERVARMPTQTADPERDGGPSFCRPGSHERDELAASPDEILPFRATRKVRAASITSMGSWKAPSILATEKSFLERSKPSSMFDEPESMPRPARMPTDPPDPTRKESIRRKPSMNARPIVEFWKPSMTPEEDAQMSRTFTLARRSSTASATSSFKAPSILSATFTDPLDALSSNVDRERSSIHSADQEWSSLDRARERERERERPGYVHADDRSVHSSNHRLEDRTGFSQLPTTPSSATYPRPGDGSRVHVPPPSASRPIVNKKSFTIDDTFPPQSSPSSRNWNMVSRSPYETRWEGSSRSPQTPEEVGRSWQPSQIRGRFSSQDMRHHFQQEGGYYGPRHVHPHHEDFEEDGSDDGFDNRSWRTRDYNERRIQDIEEGLRKREEAANKREEELARKAEELKREDEVRKKQVEEQRREEEVRRLDEEAKQREDNEADREAELRRKEEEANRKEREAKRKEEEAKRKEQEAKKKEREARLKEEEAKRKEKEARSRELEAKRKEEEVKRKEQEANSREMVARRKEEEARRKEEEVKMMEEEARRKEFEARRKQEEAERKEEEARRRTEEASLKAEEAQKKEEELRKREEELRRREEDLNRREAEMRRREGGKLQDEFRKREEEIRRQRAEDKKKQEVWETWPPETFRPTPSPQTPNSSGPWPIPNRNERSTPTAASPPIDRLSTGSSGRSIPPSGWSSTSTRPTSTTNTQPSSTPKPTGPGTPTPKPPTSSTPNPPLTEAEFHRRQAEQAQQREEQFRREQARLAMQDHERQTKAGKTMSKEEVTKLFEAHRNQWDKIQTLGSLIWEDFPWPMFKRPKGPDDLTSPCHYRIYAVIGPPSGQSHERAYQGQYSEMASRPLQLPAPSESQGERKGTSLRRCWIGSKDT